MARKYLSALLSSVASESLFSDVGIIDSNRRRCLLAERLEMFTFLKCNLLSMKLSQPVKEQNNPRSKNLQDIFSWDEN